MTTLILIFIAGLATGIAATITLYALADRRRAAALARYRMPVAGAYRPPSAEPTELDQ